MNNWHGWIIEESLDNMDFFKLFKTVKMQKSETDWHEHIVEIPENLNEAAVEFLKQYLKEGWYSHMIKGDQIKIIFKDRMFHITQGELYEHIEHYGVVHGIPKEQMDIGGLFDIAKRSGY